MIAQLEKITIAHVFYILAAGAAAGFLFVLLDRYVVAPVEPRLGITSAGAVI